jgi:hypothetical protein
MAIAVVILQLRGPDPGAGGLLQAAVPRRRCPTASPTPSSAERIHGDALPPPPEHPACATPGCSSRCCWRASACWQLNEVPAGVLAAGGPRGAVHDRVTPEGSSFDYTVEQVLADRGAPDAPGGGRRGRAPADPGSRAGVVAAFNQAFAIMVLAPWGERSAMPTRWRPTRRRLADVAGSRDLRPGLRAPSAAATRTPWSLWSVATATKSWPSGRTSCWKKLPRTPKLLGVDTDLKPTKPQLRVSIDRNRAGDLGVSASRISVARWRRCSARGGSPPSSWPDASTT